MCPSHKDARREHSSRHRRGGGLQGSPIKNVCGCKGGPDSVIKMPVNTSAVSSARIPRQEDCSSHQDLGLQVTFRCKYREMDEDIGDRSSQPEEAGDGATTLARRHCNRRSALTQRNCFSSNVKACLPREEFSVIDSGVPRPPLERFPGGKFGERFRGTNGLGVGVGGKSALADRWCLSLG